MGFFERNRRSLLEKGFSPDRLPPGQYYTERYPVLHVGDVPAADAVTPSGVRRSPNTVQ